MKPADVEGSPTEMVDPHKEVEAGTRTPSERSGWNWRSALTAEARGIVPTDVDERTDPQFSKVFYIWLSGNCNILSFSAGAAGPLVFALRFRDSALVILGFNLLCCLLPGYLSTFGPKLGMRQMIQGRYSWGFYLVSLPAALNMVTMMGFMILNCILGGETLASVSGGRLSWNVGIVLIAVISLIVSFYGYRVLNWYERLAWIPVAFTFVFMVGLGGKHLSDPPAAEPATARQILSFASTIAGFVISWGPLSSDFTSYMRYDTPSWKVFTCSYLGLLIPIVLVQTVGAAFAASVTTVPAWEAGYNEFYIGGLIDGITSPTKGFGKFLTVLMALSVTANVAPTLYSFTLNMQVVVPLLTFVPRYVFSVIATGILIPLAIIGKARFYLNLINFLGLIGYWASCFGAIALAEHLVIRRGKFRNYDAWDWDRPGRLPTGLAALFASMGSGALVWAVMDQVWWVGPIAKTTGDIGFEVAFVLTGILYIPLRTIERRLIRR